MEHFNYTAGAAFVFSFISLGITLFQWINSNEAVKIEAVRRMFDVNRQLKIVGFTVPALFKILEDSPEADPVQERNYLQLWVNQMIEIYQMRRRGQFEEDQLDSLERELSELLRMKNMRRYWEANGRFYAKSFQDYVAELINREAGEIGPPPFRN